METIIAFDGQKKILFNQPQFQNNSVMNKIENNSAMTWPNYNFIMESLNNIPDIVLSLATNGHTIISSSNSVKIKEWYLELKAKSNLKIGYVTDIENNYNMYDHIGCLTNNFLLTKDIDIYNIIVDQDSSNIVELVNLITSLMSKRTNRIVILCKVFTTGSLTSMINWPIITNYEYNVLISYLDSDRDIYNDPNNYILDIVSKSSYTFIIYRHNHDTLTQTLFFLQNKGFEVKDKNGLLKINGNSNIAVIDDMLLSHEVNTFNGILTLGLSMISKSESKLRSLSGRYYYPLISKQQYASLPQYNYYYKSYPPTYLTHNNEILYLLSPLNIMLQNALALTIGISNYFKDKDVVKFRSLIAVVAMLEIERDPFMKKYFNPPRLWRKSAKFHKRYYSKYRGSTGYHYRVNLFWDMMTAIRINKSYDEGTRNTFTDYINEWTFNNYLDIDTVRRYITLVQKIEFILFTRFPVSVNFDQRLINTAIAEPIGISREKGWTFEFTMDLPNGGYDIYGDYVSDIFSTINGSIKLIRDEKGYRVAGYHYIFIPEVSWFDGKFADVVTPISFNQVEVTTFTFSY
jgi:hypothetical protein